MIRALFSILVLGALHGTAAQADDEALRIELTVTGAKPGTGQVLISLFDSATDFLVAPLLELTAAVDSQGNASASFDGLDSGDYAIAVVYDENGNGKLDTGLFRIPSEKVGFSNNARGRFGPAKWTDARFSLSANDISIDIQLTRAKD